MPLSNNCEIAVIGAGVIGLTTALRLARSGRDVALIDPAPPGSGASYGNAGTIADYAVEPVGTPQVLRALPSLLFDHDSPLSVRRRALPSLAPWLLRFARQSLPAAARRNGAAIAALLADAGPRWHDLTVEIGARDLIRAAGCLYLYDDAGQFAAASSDVEARAALGVRAERLSPAALATLEPALAQAGRGGAVFFPEALSLADPGLVMERLAAACAAAGVQPVRAAVDTITREPSHLRLALASAPAGGRRPDETVRRMGEIQARRAVIAAGAHSRPLALQAGDRIPLETERGYHVEFDMEQAPIARPACPARLGFYLCPMTGRLRAAGTVELGGVGAPPSPHRIAAVERGARSVLPDLPPAARSWLGLRPSLPDSIPAIGPSVGGDDVLIAFGHGHLGLTMAPVTAEIIAGYVERRLPDPAFAPALPARF